MAITQIDSDTYEKPIIKQLVLSELRAERDVLMLKVESINTKVLHLKNRKDLLRDKIQELTSDIKEILALTGEEDVDPVIEPVVSEPVAPPIIEEA